MKEKLVKYKWKLLISSILLLLPSLFGLVFWNELPERIAIHWGPSGNADNWSSPLFAVLGLPLILLALHWFCMIITFCDQKQNGQNRKAFEMIFWIMPIVSAFVCGMMYAVALGIELNLFVYIAILLGVMFMVIGNYLPKCKQNRTLGIKLRWTLANEENWNKTHRLGGKIGFASGIVSLLCAFLPQDVFPYLAITLILANTVIPTVYSYRLYRKHLRKGITYTFDKYSKAGVAITVILVVIVLAVCFVISFTGEVNATVDENVLKLEATFWSDLELQLSEIERLELVESFDTGKRINGFGSAKLLLGWFENDDLDKYVLYGYVKGDVGIVLHANEKTYAIVLESAEETRALYEALSERVG